MRILQDEKLTPQQLEEFDALAKASESPVVRTLMQNIAEVLRNGGNLLSAEAVSYTHLTLPTICSV